MSQQFGQNRLYLEYSTGEFEHPIRIDGDAGFDPGDTRSMADPGTAPSTTYDRSPIDPFSISNYSPPLLDTSPSDSSSPNNPTYPNLNPYAPEQYAPERSFTNLQLGSGDSPLGFGEPSPSAPSFYPFVNVTDGGGSVDDSLNISSFPGLSPGHVVGYPNFAVSPTSELGYATQGNPQGQFSTGDASMMMATAPPPTKRAKLALDDDGVDPDQGAMYPRAGVNRPLQPAIPRPTSLAGSSQASQPIRPKLRSASSSSKNFAPQRSTETAKERKERNSHNIVEKKYRSRLNAQYEGLMNSLPPEMQLPARYAATAGSSAASEQVDKPLSKGEVLEKSTVYIKELERKHLRLKEENESLSRDMERLCSMLGGGAGGGPGGGPGGGGGGDDLGGPAC